MKHLFYTGGWKKFEELWNVIINIGGLQKMLPLLELLLSEVKMNEIEEQQHTTRNKKHRAGSAKFEQYNI